MRITYFLLAVAGFGCFLLGPALAFLNLAPGGVGFAIMAFGCFLGIVVSLIGIVVFARGSSRIMTAGALLGLAPGLFALFGLISAGQYPLVNDITTDTADPPVFIQLPGAANLSYPTSDGPIIEARYSHLAPIVMEESLETVFAACQSAANESGWELVAELESESEKTAQYTDTSGIFGFVDDIVVRVRDTDAGVVLDMRSKSREGKSDLGANARRIEHFFNLVRD